MNTGRDRSEGTMGISPLKKTTLFVAGSVFLSLALIGIALPVLPTTPFLLLSAACFCRSSERMYRWIIGNKLFGKYLANYMAGKGIPLRVKVLTLILLWSAIGYTTIISAGTILVQLVLLGVAVAVSVHIITLPTCRSGPLE